MTDTRAAITRIELFAEIMREAAALAAVCVFIAAVLICAAAMGGVK